MNAFTNIPQLPDPESKSAIEWQRPVVNSVSDALDETGYKIERLLALMDSYVGAIGDLGGLGHPITTEQVTPIYMMARLAQEGLEQVSSIFAAIGDAYDADQTRAFTGFPELVEA